MSARLALKRSLLQVVDDADDRSRFVDEIERIGTIDCRKKAKTSESEEPGAAAGSDEATARSAAQPRPASGFYGVQSCPKGFSVSVSCNSPAQVQELGTFETKEEAALCYDKFARANNYAHELCNFGSLEHAQAAAAAAKLSVLRQRSPKGGAAAMSPKAGKLKEGDQTGSGATTIQPEPNPLQTNTAQPCGNGVKKLGRNGKPKEPPKAPPPKSSDASPGNKVSEFRKCSDCGCDFTRDFFSGRQWALDERRCVGCIGPRSFGGGAADMAVKAVPKKAVNLLSEEISQRIRVVSLAADQSKAARKAEIKRQSLGEGGRQSQVAVESGIQKDVKPKEERKLRNSVAVGGPGQCSVCSNCKQLCDELKAGVCQKCRGNDVCNGVSNGSPLAASPKRRRGKQLPGLDHDLPTKRNRAVLEQKKLVGKDSPSSDKPQVTVLLLEPGC